MPYLHKLDYIMPLVSPKKSSKADWQLLIDKVANIYHIRKQNL
jgi:hypothetical protein